MINEGASGGAPPANNDGSSRGAMGSEGNEMAANFERAEGSNRERASTMDLKSNQGAAR